MPTSHHIQKLTKNGSQTQIKELKLYNSQKKKTSVNLCDLGLAKGFLGMEPKAPATKEKIKQTSSNLETSVLQRTTSRK